MPGPLTGIRVLDFTWHLAGPFGSMQLADLGAEVWKIEMVYANEENRGPGPVVDGINTYFYSINRGKHSLAMDLRDPDVKQIVYTLIEQVDVLTENFTPGALERLGFGYEEASRRNPRLVYASTSGFGQTGPYRNRSAVDVIVQGMGGVISITGHPDGPPARPGYSIGDMAGGLFTTIGVLGALVERQQSGLGQRIDVSMLDSQVALLENAIVRYAATGELPQRIGTRHPLTTPFQLFPTQDGGVVVAGVKDWELFCAAIGRDDLMFDERYLTNPLRTQNHAQLEPELLKTFAEKTTDEWIAILSEVCLIGPMNTIDRVVADPQIQERDMIVSLPTWNGGALRVSGSPIKLSRTPGGPVEGADRPGGHTAQVLKEHAGLTDEQINALVERGVIAI